MRTVQLLILLALISPSAQAVENTRPNSHAINYAGKNWSLARKNDPIVSRVSKDILKAYPEPKGSPVRTTYGDVVVAVEVRHRTYVACGTEYYQGEVAPMPFIWIPATKSLLSGPTGIGEKCAKYGLTTRF